MGYFDNIFPGLQQDPNTPPAYGKRIRKAGRDYSLVDQPEVQDDEFAVPADEADNLRTDAPDPKVELKTKVKSAHADIQSAFSQALKVLREAPDTSGVNADPEGAAFGLGGNTDRTDIEAAVVRAAKMDNPIKLADDLRIIGSRKTIPPEYAKKLLTAADKLTRAYQAQGELEALRQPGQALAVGPQEVTGRKEYLAGEIKKREESLKTAGSLRSPQLQDELKKLREEEGRVNLVTQQPQQGSEMPAPTPENPAGNKPLESNFRALGIQKPQMVDSIIQAMQVMGLDPRELDRMDVPFESGMLRTLAAIDPQANLAKRAVAEVKSWQDPQMAQPQKGEQRLVTKDVEMKEKQYRVRQLYAELGTSPFGNTWLGHIAYVLLGLLMGPSMAAKILSRRNDGALKAEIEYLKQDIRHEMERRERDEREQQEYRKMYVQHYLQSQRQTQDDQRAFRQQFFLTQLRGAQALERAKLTKKAAKDPVLTGLEQDFRNATSMAGKYAQAMDMEKAAAWNKKAESLIPLIQQRRAQLGTVEEPEGAEETEE